MRRYLHKTFPSYSEDYISYCINCSSDDTPALLVVKDDKIVGCQLFYCTQAVIYDKKTNVQWGHDTFLDKEYRSEIGLDFVWSINSIKGIFGIGLTEVNRKIYQLLKAVFFEGVFNYYFVNLYLALNIFQKILHIKHSSSWVDKIKCNNSIFRKVDSVTEINIPNEGYWFKGVNDIDFIRDADFINQRFFKSVVNDYAVYASKDAYFVVRETSFHGLPALLLCDFRYDPYNKDSVSDLINGVKTIARKSRLGVLYFSSGDSNFNKYFKNRLHYKRPVDFVSTMKVSEKSSFTITGADADAELLC